MTNADVQHAVTTEIREYLANTRTNVLDPKTWHAQANELAERLAKQGLLRDESPARHDHGEHPIPEYKFNAICVCKHIDAQHVVARFAGFDQIQRAECTVAGCGCMTFTARQTTDDDDAIENARRSVLVVEQAKQRMLQNERDELGRQLLVVKADAYDMAAHLVRLRRLAEDVLSSGVEFDDERIKYLTVQIDRDTWTELQKEIKQ